MAPAPRAIRQLSTAQANVAPGLHPRYTAVVSGKKPNDLLRRFTKNAKRKGAKVHPHTWYASADFKDGRRVEIFLPEMKRKRG